MNLCHDHNLVTGKIMLLDSLSENLFGDSIGIDLELQNMNMRSFTFRRISLLTLAVSKALMPASYLMTYSTD